MSRRGWILLPQSTRSSGTAQEYLKSTLPAEGDNLILIFHVKEKKKRTRSGAIEIQSPSHAQKLAR